MATYATGIPTAIIIPLIWFSSIIHGEEFNSRQEKLLFRSQNKFQCESEGFHADPYDCSVFYRCIDWGESSENSLQSRFTSFKFQCGGGSVFDPETNSCSHPSDTSRVECRGEYLEPLSFNIPRADALQSTNDHSNNGVDYGVLQEQGDQPPQQAPPYANRPATDSQLEPMGEVDNNAIADSTPPRVTRSPPCSAEGFFPIENDCTHFYRCVSSGRGFMKYEFACGEGTVWDPDNNACNHAWAVQRTDCKTTGESGNTGANNQGGENGQVEGNQPEGIDNNQNPDAEPEQIPQGDSSSETPPPHSSSTTNPDASSQTTKNPNEGGSYNGPNGDNDGHQGNVTQGPNNAGNKNGTCPAEGFHPVEGDCKKFIRCVNNGDGGFTRYEFECAEGTVWDVDGVTCNYPYAVQRSDCKADSGNQTTSESAATSSTPGTTNNQQGSPSGVNQQTPTTVGQQTSSVSGQQSSSSSGQQTTASLGQQGYGQQTSSTSGQQASSSSSTSNQQTSSSSGQQTGSTSTTSGQQTSSTSQQQTSTTVQQSSSSNNQQGSTSASSQQTSTTGSNQQSSTSGSSQQTSSTGSSSQTTSGGNQQGSTSGSSQQTSSIGSSSQTTSAGNQQGSTSGSSQQTSSTGSSSQTTSAGNQQGSTSASSQQTSSTGSSSQTTSAGNQQGSTSGSNQQTSSTGSSSQTASGSQQGSTSASGQQTSTTGSNFQTTTGSSQQGSSTGNGQQTSTTGNNFQSTSGSNQQSTNSSQTSTTSGTSQATNQNKEDVCSAEGFFPSSANCNKFYRCVKNEGSGYSKYEFNCGPGTVWDPDNNVCNHPWAVQNGKCRSDGQGTFPGSETTSNNSESAGNTSSTTAAYGTTSNPTKNNATMTDKPLVASTTVPNKNITSSTNAPSSSAASSPTTTTAVTTSNGTTQPEGSTSPSNVESTTSADNETTSTTMSPYENATSTASNNTKPTNNITCTKAGFYPYPGNCKKFYRCVDWDGDKGERFSVYYFDCPAGTIFDPSLSICNHENSVYPPRDCSGNASQTDTSTPSPSSNSTNTTGSTDNETSTVTAEGTTTNATESYTEQTTAGSSETNATNGILTTQSVTDSTTEGIPNEISTQTTTNAPTAMTTDSNSAGTTNSVVTSMTTTATSEEGTTSTSGQTTLNPTTAEITTISSTQVSETCPELGPDQFAIVCPTGFRRHPKYCNVFYQCTVPQPNEIKVLTLSCTNGTVYDDKRIQCLPPDQAKKCDGSMMDTRNLRQITNSAAPIAVKSDKTICPNEGSFSYKDDCRLFYKCKKDNEGKLNGYIYQCPEGYAYWNVSKRCEKTEKVPCEGEKKPTAIWKSTLAPVEMKNIGNK